MYGACKSSGRASSSNWVAGTAQSTSDQDIAAWARIPATSLVVSRYLGSGMLCMYIYPRLQSTIHTNLAKLRLSSGLDDRPLSSQSAASCTKSFR
eukprot:s8939_g2.t1